MPHAQSPQCAEQWHLGARHVVEIRSLPLPFLLLKPCFIASQVKADFQEAAFDFLKRAFAKVLDAKKVRFPLLEQLPNRHDARTFH